VSRTPGWTTAEDIRAKVRRRWADGSLLRALASGDPFPQIDLPVRGPRPADIGADLGAVQRWVAALEAGARQGSRYTVDYVDVGGREIGRNRLPGRVRVTAYEHAWALLGVADQVAAYRRILDVTAAEPTVHSWAVGQPMKALEVADDWPALVAAYRWLGQERGSGRYLREISAPGVDTKFVERHRPVLARLLGTPSTAAGFVAALGLRAKPSTVRLRFAPVVLGLAHPLTEATFRLGELAAADINVRTAVIVENEITYLSVPIPDDGIVLWGKGFEVGQVGSLPWLAGAEVRYWGDLDTHGFAILHQLRAWLPQTRSFLMDRETLLAHRDRWGREDSPTAARLDRLTDAESALYSDLVSDRFGPAVRLEQERIDWAWAEREISTWCGGREVRATS
jgi:hypothetical protein